MVDPPDECPPLENKTPIYHITENTLTGKCGYICVVEKLTKGDKTSCLIKTDDKWMFDLTKLKGSPFERGKCWKIDKSNCLNVLLPCIFLRTSYH